MRNNLGIIYLKVGFIWLLAGMLFGTWMGITENFQFSNAHAHANLVGFVLPVLFGLVVMKIPAMLDSKLAPAQFWVYQVGALALVGGKVLVALDPADHALVAAGSLITMAGTAMFVWMLFTHRTS